MCYCESSPSFWNTSDPIARKEHQCCECGTTIRPGQKYERTSGLWDGDFCTFKICQNCKRIRESLMALPGKRDCYEFGGLYEDMRNFFDTRDDMEKFLAQFK
jgi:hypothetical protein